MRSPGAERQRAAMLVDAGRASDALDILGSLLAREPEDSATLRVAALAHAGAGSPGEGLPLAQKAVVLAPHDSVGWRVLASVAAEAGEAEVARKAAGRAVEIAPSSVEAHCVLVNVDIMTGGITARTDCSSAEALRLSPDAVAPRLAAGRLALAKRRWLVAEEAYLAVLAIEPSNAIAMNNLAAARMNQKKLGDAAGDLIRALGSDPTLTVASANLRRAARGLILQVVALVLVATLSGEALLSFREQTPPSVTNGVVILSAGAAIIPVFIAFALSIEFVKKLGRHRGALFSQVLVDRSNLAALILAVVALGLVAMSYELAPLAGVIVGSAATAVMVVALFVMLQARWRDRWS